MSKHIKVQTDFSEIYDKFSDPQATQGRRALITQVESDSRPFVPKKDNTLRSATSVTLDARSLIYNTPYAAYQYFNQLENYTTPGTGPRWAEKAKGIYMSDWAKAYSKGAGF